MNQNLKFPNDFLWVESKLFYFQRVLQKIIPDFLVTKPRSFAGTAKERLGFPKDFFWGSSTASYQVEGGIENNDWARPTLAWPSLNGQALVKAKTLPLAGRACDHYNRYEEDFDIAKSLDQNAHRFSIEWARVEPEEGRFDGGAIEHYRKVLMALRERGLEPFVTLWHFTLPIWFAKMGGFENKKAPFYFARYCEYVISRIGDGANFWITINEPMVYGGQSYWRDVWPPFKKNIFKFIKVVDNLAMSHNIAYEKIKSIQPSTQVGVAKHQINFETNNNPANRLLAKFLIWFWNHRFLAQISKSQDFIGVNYYFHRKFGDKNEYEKSDMGWDIYPKGIYNVLMELKRYRKPIYITENGLADATDTRRAKFIKDHLYWVHRGIHDGCDVRGYLYWSLMDNFEWAHGFGPRFGLIEMNYETMERRIRSSAYEYAKICKANSL